VNVDTILRWGITTDTYISDDVCMQSSMVVSFTHTNMFY